MIKRILDLLLLVLTILFSSIFLTALFSPIYEIIILSVNHKLSFESWSVYCKIVNYLLNPFVNNLKVEPFTLSNHGLIHFADVKNIMIVIEIITMTLILGSLLRLRSLKKAKMLWQLHYGLNFAMWAGFPVAFGLAGNFNELFLMMHRILFKNNYWLFDVKMDSVILLMPESLFIMCALSILGLYELFVHYFYRKTK